MWSISSQSPTEHNYERNEHEDLQWDTIRSSVVIAALALYEWAVFGTDVNMKSVFGTAAVIIELNQSIKFMFCWSVETLYVYVASDFGNCRKENRPPQDGVNWRRS